MPVVVRSGCSADLGRAELDPGNGSRPNDGHDDVQVLEIARSSPVKIGTRMEPDWNRIFSSLRLNSEPCTCMRTAARRPPIFQNIRAADPVFSASTPEQGASQTLARFHHHTTAAGKHGAATLSHSQTFDPKFHPSSIGPRQGINCRGAIVWSDCLGQWSPSRCSANSPLPRHGQSARLPWR